MDIILERSKEGKCAICKCETIEEKREVDYKGNKICICTKHPYLEPKVSREEINGEIKIVRKARKKKTK